MSRYPDPPRARGSLLARLLISGLAAVLVQNAGAAQYLEEVVVTATKREQASQDVPISLTTFTGETAEALGFQQNFDIAAHVPNLQFKSEFGITSPIIFMRGIGNTSFYANSINPVSLYVDGVYIGQNVVQGFQLFDMERIEVLRGPQGTLFGHNTTGGLVNFITRKPEVQDGVNGRVRVTAGNYGQLNVDAAGGIPLGDRAAARVALLHQSSDGVFDNVNPARPGGDDGEIDTFAARALLNWDITDALNAILNVHYGDNESELRGFKPGYIESPFGVPNCPPGALSGGFGNGCSDPFGFGLTDAPGFHDTKLSADTLEDVETYGVALEVNLELDRHTLTSVTAFDTVDMVRFEDDDANVLVLLNDTFLADSEFWSQELRLTSNYAGKFNWLAGFHYYADDLKSQIHFNNLDFGPGLFTGVIPEGLGENLHQESESWAVFGEVNYDFTERWRLTLGLRLTQDDRSAVLDTFVFDATRVPALSPISVDQARAAMLFPILTPVEVKSDWFEWSGRAALDYRIDDNQLVYVSASRGFKGGEFNGGALFDLSEVTISDPEFVDNYEIGYKGTLLDQTLQFNITGFYMEYKDQQLLISSATPFGLLPSLQNAGSSEIKGVEFEIQWQPHPQWFLLLGGSHLDAEFEEFLDPVLGIDRSGNRLPEAPKWSFNGLVRYEQPLANGTLSLQTDWFWNDDREFVVENNPGLREDAYGIINARAGYRFWNDRAEVALFVKNVFDKNFIISGFDTAGAGFGANIFQPGDPRTFGAQFSISYE